MHKAVELALKPNLISFVPGCYLARRYIRRYVDETKDNMRAKVAGLAE